MLEQHAELVAAETGERVAGAHRVLEQSRQLPEQTVPGRVPAAVVDDLEAIEIDEHQRVHAALGARLLEHACEPHLELGAIDQTGQRVVHRPVAHLAAQPPLLGHVVEDDHHAAHLPVGVPDRRGRVLDGELLAAAREQQRVRGERDDGVLGERHQGRIGAAQPRGLVHDVEDLAEPSPVGLGLRPTGQPLGDGVEPGDATARVGGDDRVPDRTQRHLEQIPTVAGLAIRQTKIGDVPASPGDARLRVVEGVPGEAEVADAAVLEHHAQLHVERAARVRDRVQRARHLCAVLGVDPLAPAFEPVRLVLGRKPVKTAHPLVPVQAVARRLVGPDADPSAVDRAEHAAVRPLEHPASLDLLADVLERPVQAGDAAFGVALGRTDRAYPQPPPAAGDERHLQVPRRAPAHRLLDRGADDRSRLRRVEVDRLLERRSVVVVHLVDAPRLPRPAHRRARDLELPAADAGDLAGAIEQLPASAHRLLALLAPGDVEPRAEHPDGRAVLAARLHAPLVVHPDPAPGAVAHADLALVARRAAVEVFARDVPPCAAGRPGCTDSTQRSRGEVPRGVGGAQADDPGRALVPARLAGVHACHSQVPAPVASMMEASRQRSSASAPSVRRRSVTSSETACARSGRTVRVALEHGGEPHVDDLARAAHHAQRHVLAA